MSAEPTSETILGCPFCGNQAVLTPCSDGTLYIDCDTKRCVEPGIHEIREQAIKAWNTRPNQSPWKEIAEGLANELENHSNSAVSLGRMRTSKLYWLQKYHDAKAKDQPLPEEPVENTERQLSDETVENLYNRTSPLRPEGPKQ